MSNLLIIADIDDKCLATPRGLQLAEAMDLKPEIVAFVFTDLKRLKLDPKAKAAIKKQIIAERRNTLIKRVEKYAGSAHGVKISVIWSEDVAPWICKRASDDYAAIVKTRHQSESIGHLSTDWQLLREAPVPLLLVSDKKFKKNAVIMATVDLDASSREKQNLNVEVLITARHYAEMLEAELTVLCVIDVPTILSDLDLVDPKTYAKNRQWELQPVVEKLAKDSGLPLSVFKLKRGPVAKTIVSEANAKRARLVVMGTVGRRGVKAKLLGNTAEDVLSLLRMDTLTLKP